MVTIEANAKINLTLDILGKRPDGFHEVAMVMQTIGLHDTMVMEKTESEIELSISVPWLKADEKNLAWRGCAYGTYKAHSHCGGACRRER